jgi:hypothetical protein
MEKTDDIPNPVGSQQKKAVVSTSNDDGFDDLPPLEEVNGGGSDDSLSSSFSYGEEEIPDSVTTRPWRDPRRFVYAKPQPPFSMDTILKRVAVDNDRTRITVAPRPLAKMEAFLEESNKEEEEEEEKEEKMPPLYHCLVQWKYREADGLYVWSKEKGSWDAGKGPRRAELYIFAEPESTMPSPQMILGRFAIVLYRLLEARPTMDATLVHFLEGEIIRHVAKITHSDVKAAFPHEGMDFTHEKMEEAVGMVIAAMQSISPNYLSFHFCNDGNSHFTVPLNIAKKYITAAAEVNV